MTPTVTPSATPTITPTITATPLITPALRPLPGNPQPYLTTYRLLTFYGNPLSSRLGVLGAAPRGTVLSQLRATVTLYQPLSPEQTVLPTYHLITTVADRHPGTDGSYSHQLSHDIIEDWITAAIKEGVAVILDIQPGYADLMQEFNNLKPYFYNPHVHLAIDSEFVMTGGKVPGESLGTLYGSQINPIQAELNQIALEIGVNKVLIVHQFDPIMLRNKADIANYPHVELVIDADGFGSPEAKIGDYLQYANEPGFEYGGFKLFYGWDVPLMRPAGVMALEPPPAVIIYQ